MGNYSNIYNWFTWIHVNTYFALMLIGSVFAAGIRLLSPGQYKKYHDEYKEYIHLTGIPYSSRDFRFCVACTLIYGTSMKECFLYEFAKLNDKGRREYITERNRYRLYPHFNGAKKRVEMQNKYRAYKDYKQFYKREAMYIGKNTTLDEVQAFFETRDAAILKPNMSGVGKGVEMFRLDAFESREAAFAYLMTKQNFIMEELVHQVGLMRSLHPQSVNTVRVYAVRLKTGVEIFGCHLRIGQGDKIVDNAGRGGVIVSIDNDGIAWRSGMDEFGHIYVTHPDTGVFLPGLKMPEWDQARKLVEEAMQVHPDIRFVGWDLAHTEKGWIIIEANDNGQFHGYQIPYHKGIMQQMKAYIPQLGE